MTDTETTRTVQTRSVLWTNGDRYYFASIDGGQTWIETDRRATVDDADGVAAILAGTVDPDTGATRYPITMVARYFELSPDEWTATEPVTETRRTS
jgi:hypothetical protein